MNAQYDLELEIEKSTKRLEVRKTEIDIEINELSTKIEKYTDWAWGFVILGFFIAIMSIFFYLCKNTENGFGLNLLGDFMAGTVASIWSLAGLFFIYVAFLGQKQQLLNQQLELMFSQLEVKYTRLELSGQKLEMIEQNKTLKQQRFENTFFQMLTLFSSITNNLELRESGRTVIAKGRDCFEEYYKNLKIKFHDLSLFEGYSESIKNTSIKEIVEAYDELYSDEKADLSHYFRTIYHIIKFVHNSNIENKKQYISIARAQLSSYEQILIFYNCLHANGSEKFKPLIEEYTLFKNIDESLIFNPEHMKGYIDSAYKK